MIDIEMVKDQKKIKAGQVKVKSKSRFNKKDEYIDTRFPRMFSDENSVERLAQATRIIDLKNLGPSSELEFHRAGIKNAQQLLGMGWEKAYTQLVRANHKNCHSMFAYAIIGAVKNVEWSRISEEDKQAAKKLSAILREKISKKAKSQ